MTEVITADLVKLIGTPFISNKFQAPCDKYLEQVYEKAFSERMAPLYLHKFKYEGWSDDSRRTLLFRSKAGKNDAEGTVGFGQ